MPDGVTIPGGPSFIGTPQPPDVPCDPTGEGWRGPPGPPGPGSVISIATTAPGISGGPITTTGTLAVQWNAGAVTALGATLQLSGGTLNAVGAAPGGTAGGDLAGTYPNPTLVTTAVTPGSYTHTTLTVDAKGRLTAASSGTVTSGTVTSVATTGPGITGGTITGTGTLAVQWNAGTVSSLSGLSLAAGVLTAAPAAASITGTLAYNQLPNEVQQLPISFPFSGKPATGALVNVPMAFAVTVPASLAGTVVYDTTKTTASAAFTVNRITVAGATTALGSVTITSTSNTSATLAGAGGSLAVGDTLQIVAPAQDATLADCSITILAARV